MEITIKNDSLQRSLLYRDHWGTRDIHQTPSQES